MPNRNYERGVRFEREIQKNLESRGFITIRASGSHGKFDIVGIHPLEGVLLIQAKVTEKPSEAHRLISEWRSSPPLPKSEKFRQEIWVKVPRKFIEIGIL